MTRCTRLAMYLMAAVFVLGSSPLAAGAGEMAGDSGAQGPVISIDGLSFDSWSDYAQSDYFRAAGGRCSTPEPEARELLYGSPQLDVPADCSATATNPTSAYDSTILYEIPVVVHIIMDSSCTQGAISTALVQSQIEILNEDFLALMGSPGSLGNDAQIRFVLASVDPNGNPTRGITRTCNTQWFNDNGTYWNTLAWDPNRYLNIYTNQASGALGYVPFLPADAGGSLVGTPQDRVVVLWSAFGRNAPFGPPYDQGRTATHEVGHYLGMEHTFNGGCAPATPPACYTTGDLICDTNSEATPTFSPCFVGAKSTCGSVDPSDNYMDYSDDLCMEQFTPEQAKRIRCTLESWRPNVYQVIPYDLTLTPQLAGATNTWAVTGAKPGETTYFLYGTAAGSRPVPGCPGQTVGIGGVQILATDVADAAGNADFSLFVPAGVSGSTFLFQAVELSTCKVSQLLTVTFP